MYLSMSSPTTTRKRPAPGSGPVLPVQPFQPTAAYAAPQDQVFRWNNSGVVSDANFATTMDPTRNAGAFMMNAQQQPQQQQNQYPASTGSAAYQPPPQQVPTSNAVARRPNRALVQTVAHPPPSFDGGLPGDAWPTFADDATLLQPAVTGTPVNEHDNIQVLEEKAQRAKREAQANRKQIPPFVQKLSSFLEEQKNTDLIRWSEKGDSFIVLDEDEFAKTLIPELFKHNNYASFVRQLNMYGFHKRVGLSDNSMKASERKNKSPSEYYNPYFKRGHPNLLWLINKPKSGTSKKKGKKEDGDADSEEEAVVEEGYNQNLLGQGQHSSRGFANDVGALQKKDLQLVRDQLNHVQQQQKAISTMITRLRQEHHQLYQQAVAFQSMHERHENSINAILNFLANVFRKSLEEQGGPQSVQDLLASIIPNSGGNQMPQRNIVDLGDLGEFIHPQPREHSTVSPPPKRHQRLLPPIPDSGGGGGGGGGGKASTIDSPASTTCPYGGVLPQGQIGTITEVFDTASETPSSNYVKRELQANPQESMMKIINDTNAGGTSRSGIDLPEVAARTPTTMTSEQRNQVLNIMARQSSMPELPRHAMAPTTAPGLVTSTTAAPPTTASHMPSSLSATIPVTADAASSSLSPPRLPASPPPTAAPPTTTSLSPIISSLPPPSLQDLSLIGSDVDMLQRLQEDQSSKLDSLGHYLAQLSPSGRIPGIDDSGAGGGGGNTPGASGSYFPDHLDLDQFLESSAFADGGGLGFDGTDFGSGNVEDGNAAPGAADAGIGGGSAGGVGAGNFDFGLPYVGGTIGGEVQNLGNEASPDDTDELFGESTTQNTDRDAKRRRMG